MSKQDETDDEVRLNSEESSDKSTTVNQKSQKARSTKQSDRIMIFNKED